MANRFPPKQMCNKQAHILPIIRTQNMIFSTGLVWHYCSVLRCIESLHGNYTIRTPFAGCSFIKHLSDKRCVCISPPHRVVVELYYIRFCHRTSLAVCHNVFCSQFTRITLDPKTWKCFQARCENAKTLLLRSQALPSGGSKYCQFPRNEEMNLFCYLERIRSWCSKFDGDGRCDFAST